MHPCRDGWAPNTCTVQSFNPSKQGPRCWDQNKETSRLLSSCCGWTPTKGDCMFSAILDSMIHYFFTDVQDYFFFPPLSLKALVKIHSDAQGHVPSQEKFLWENWPKMHESEGIFCSVVPINLIFLCRIKEFVSAFLSECAYAWLFHDAFKNEI